MSEMPDFKKIQAIKAEFEDVPGTYLFNSDRCKAGYHLNMFCLSMSKEANRRAFLVDEAEYLNAYPLTPAQRTAVLERDWLAMIQLGGNIYHTAKLGATCGKSFQYLAGEMTGMGQKDYREMMVNGGRPIKGNRSKTNNA